jgi:hypothetical protein
LTHCKGAHMLQTDALQPNIHEAFRTYVFTLFLPLKWLIKLVKPNTGLRLI